MSANSSLLVSRPAPRVLAVIPARRGSKGIRYKNMKPLGVVPLVEWTIRAALNSAFITKTVVSTDWPEVAFLAERCGVPTPWLRPKHLSKDDSASLDVVLDAIDREREQKHHYDFVALLEPTAPLRRDQDIDNVIAALSRRRAHSDAAITADAANFHPSALRKKVGLLSEAYFPETPFVERRQDGEQAFMPTGHCFLIKPEILYSEKTFYPRRTLLVELEEFQGVELDTPVDWQVAEALLRENRGRVVR